MRRLEVEWSSDDEVRSYRGALERPGRFVPALAEGAGRFDLNPDLRHRQRGPGNNLDGNEGFRVGRIVLGSGRFNGLR
jgi:hypothetical protein